MEEKDASEDEQLINLVNGGIMAVRCPLLFELLEQVEPNKKVVEVATDVIALATQKSQGRYQIV